MSDKEAKLNSKQRRKHDDEHVRRSRLEEPNLALNTLVWAAELKILEDEDCAGVRTRGIATNKRKRTGGCESDNSTTAVATAVPLHREQNCELKGGKGEKQHFTTNSGEECTKGTPMALRKDENSGKGGGQTKRTAVAPRLPPIDMRLALSSLPNPPSSAPGADEPTQVPILDDGSVKDSDEAHIDVYSPCSRVSVSNQGIAADTGSVLVVPAEKVMLGIADYTPLLCTSNVRKWQCHTANDKDFFFCPEGLLVQCHRCTGKNRTNGILTMRRPYDLSHWIEHCNTAGHRDSMATWAAEIEFARESGRKKKTQRKSNMLNYFTVNKKKTRGEVASPKTPNNSVINIDANTNGTTSCLRNV